MGAAGAMFVACGSNGRPSVPAAYSAQISGVRTSTLVADSDDLLSWGRSGRERIERLETYASPLKKGESRLISGWPVTEPPALPMTVVTFRAWTSG